MNRREFLGLTSVGMTLGVSGCSTDDTPEQETDTSRYRVTGSADNPTPGIPLEFTVDVNPAEEQAPPSLTIEVTNTGSSPLKLSAGFRELFSSIQAEGGSPKAQLLAEEEWSESMLAEEDCWKIPGQIVQPEVMNYTTLDAGTSESITLYLFGTRNVSETQCLPVAESQFKEKYHVQSDTLDESFTWGFTLQRVSH